MAKEKYPECEKMQSVRDDSQKIGEFLEWLDQNKMFVAEYNHMDFAQPIRLRREQLLAKYFEIDLDKVENERRKILRGSSESMSAPKPIWTVRIKEKVYWTDSEESARDIIRALGDCEYNQTADGTWNELVASTLATGVKSKICGYDGALCNLVKCNLPEVRMTASAVTTRYCQKMDDRI